MNIWVLCTEFLLIDCFCTLTSLTLRLLLLVTLEITTLFPLHMKDRLHFYLIILFKKKISLF